MAMGEIKSGEGGTGDHTPAGGKATPSIDNPTAHLFGTQAGPLLTSEGRGVVGGIPYGEQLQSEADALQRQYLFQPGVAARFRALTRKALRR